MLIYCLFTGTNDCFNVFFLTQFIHKDLIKIIKCIIGVVMLLRSSYKALVAGVVLLFSQNSFAEQKTNTQTINEIDHLSIPYVNKNIDIDGDINDDEWSQALSIELNIVNDPWNNKPSPVKTTAKIFENGETIYISFIAQDPNPEEILAYLGDRDTRLLDDVVGIKLDTYNNRRLSYELFVNPYGSQIDRIKNELTGSVNDAWDGMWQSYGKRTEHGYQVEMAVPYHTLNFADTNEEKTWAIEFIRLYPRDSRLRISHIPLDRDNDCFSVFETGAIMIYLAEKSGRFLPQNDKERSQVMQWLMFQMSGIGPMMGQANVFYRYFPEKIQPVIDRYQNEVKRLFSVLDLQLKETEYLTSEYSIADMANWCWVHTHEWSGVSLDGLPNLRRWVDQIAQRPAVQKGILVPEPINVDKDSFIKGARSILTK